MPCCLPLIQFSLAQTGIQSVTQADIEQGKKGALSLLFWCPQSLKILQAPPFVLEDDKNLSWREGQNRVLPPLM